MIRGWMFINNQKTDLFVFTPSSYLYLLFREIVLNGFPYFFALKYVKNRILLDIFFIYDNI